MKYKFITLFISISLLFYQSVYLQAQQQTLKIIITDEEDLPLPGVNLLLIESNRGIDTDFDGIATLTVSQGETLQISVIGYETITQKITAQTPSSLEVQMTPQIENLENIVLQSTRKSRQIADEVNRIEVIAGEELEEKFNMNAGNISMLLRESTGIQVQQTSATSANANFKIQGLDGRYTQLLQDGFPLYSGFSGGLSIMQIPPLNIKQVEILKGSNSTLYGGGAIAGLINLITKEPEEESELALMANAISSGGYDFNGYYTAKLGEFGITFYTTANIQNAYDPDNDGFSDIPEFQRYTINPRLFYYLSESTSLNIGFNYIKETRKGGNLRAIHSPCKDCEQTYLEKNYSQRISTNFNFHHKFSVHQNFTLKGSFSHFDRNIEEIRLTPYEFSGNQQASFAEANYYQKTGDWEFVVGLNFWKDRFQENQRGNQAKRDYSDDIFGGFSQITWNLNQNWTAEVGMRLDYENHYGIFALPRLSVMYKALPSLTFRIGGGLGYKTPTIFIQDTESLLFRNVTLAKYDLNAERSHGLNFDYNYKTSFWDDVFVSFNQLFFYTRLDNPIEIQYHASQKEHKLINAASHFDTKGVENNLKVSYSDYKLFLQYTYTDFEKHHEGEKKEVNLTPRHRAGAVLVYEVEEMCRIGYEVYYTGTQRLNSGMRSRDFITMGIMGEYHFEPVDGIRIVAYLNFENFTDVRITNWQKNWGGSIKNPQFNTEIYAPTDGFLINGGLKIYL